MTQPALDLVIAALATIRERSDHLPRASRTVLARLQTISPVVVSQRETSASLIGKRLQGALNKAQLLEPIRERVCACTKCAKLASSRTQTVFGVGNPDADLMFIGEAPGADEDQQGEPFVGRAGQLLTRIIKAMNFAREDVYIANVLKCRPDTPSGSFGNRAPTPTEMQTCLKSKLFSRKSWSRWAQLPWKACLACEEPCANCAAAGTLTAVSRS